MIPIENVIPRVMPHNKEAEQSILGSMLVDKDCAIMSFEGVKPEDFYLDANRLIFEAMLRLFDRNEPIDIVTVAAELTSTGHLDAVGGVEYLSYLATTLPTTANLRQYIDLVQDRSMLRKLINVSTSILDKSYSPSENAQSVADEAETMIFEVLQNQENRGLVHIRDVLLQTHDALAELYQNKGRLTGVSSGLADLDKILHGFQKSDYILIAARPGVGKSSLALNIATNAAIRGHVPVAYFSLEMPNVQLVSRMISSEMLIDSERLRTGELENEDWEKIAASLDLLGDAPIYIDDSTKLSVSDIRTKCLQLKLEKGLGMVVIDYMQLMQGSRAESRQQEVSDISRSLKILAKELDVPIVVLAQLSRAPEQRGKEDRRPVLSDIRESGSIEQDADVVLFLYADKDNNETENCNIVECIIAKHRNGERGTVKLNWMGKYTRFMSLDERHED